MASATVLKLLLLRMQVSLAHDLEVLATLAVAASPAVEATAAAAAVVLTLVAGKLEGVLPVAALQVAEDGSSSRHCSSQCT